MFGIWFVSDFKNRRHFVFIWRWFRGFCTTPNGLTIAENTNDQDAGDFEDEIIEPPLFPVQRSIFGTNLGVGSISIVPPSLIFVPEAAAGSSGKKGGKGMMGQLRPDDMKGSSLGRTGMDLPLDRPKVTPIGAGADIFGKKGGKGKAMAKDAPGAAAAASGDMKGNGKSEKGKGAPENDGRRVMLIATRMFASSCALKGAVMWITV